MESGSSPLARGLPGPAPECAGGRRIIPARAGFTPTAPGLTRFARDHPRSRGVYPTISPHGRNAPGSSPLARGLLCYTPASDRYSRIIPARAGFTGWNGARHQGRPDHPRSRGVYGEADQFPRFRTGSSPLARGLPLEVRDLPVEARIIPARAGFTRAQGRPVGRAADHPRSRGVYVR